MGERLVDRALVARGTPRVERLDLRPLDRGIDGDDAAALRDVGERRRRGLGERVHTHDLLITRLDTTDALGAALHEPALHRVDHLERPTAVEHPLQFGLGGRAQLGDLGLDDLRTLEQVAVLEQVGLVREHLLDAQRPLLIPRRRQAERFVPARELDGARARVLREGDAQHLEHDALHVVLGLLFSEAERIHLHAVPEPAQLLVLDAVPLAADVVPHLRERAHLAHLFDEAHTRVDEEGDAADDLRELVLGDLPGLAHRVEHRDRVRESVRELLHRRRARLLQVIRADVDRVPRGHLLDRVDDQVDGESLRRLRREDVRAARQVLLEDVVLRGALERRVRHTLLVGEREVHPEQPHCGGVDRHRRVHLRERDAVEQLSHLAQMRHRDADLAHLAPGEHVVGVVAGLGGEVERDRQPRLPLGQVGAVQLVRRAGGGVPGVRANEPRSVGHRANCRLRWPELPIRRRTDLCAGPDASNCWRRRGTKTVRIPSNSWSAWGTSATGIAIRVDFSALSATSSTLMAERRGWIGARRGLTRRRGGGRRSRRRRRPPPGTGRGATRGARRRGGPRTSRRSRGDGRWRRSGWRPARQGARPAGAPRCVGRAGCRAHARAPRGRSASSAKQPREPATIAAHISDPASRRSPRPAPRRARGRLRARTA